VDEGMREEDVVDDMVVWDRLGGGKPQSRNYFIPNCKFNPSSTLF